MNTPILEVQGLKKYFPIVAGVLRHQVGEMKAVDGVDFIIPQNGTVGLVGESGCGKSTVARTIIRLLEPTAGTVLYQGQDLAKLGHKELNALRKEIQIVFQDPMLSLNPRKSIGASLSEPLQYHRMLPDEQAIQKRVIETLEQIGLSESTMDRYPHEFSGGQLQRICIGRAVIMQPKLVICDEAVSALDTSVQGQILNLLVDFQKRLGLSYLFIAHDLSVVRHFCDHVVVMYRGKVVESAPTDALFNSPKDPYTKRLLEAIPGKAKRQKAKGKNSEFGI